MILRYYRPIEWTKRKLHILVFKMTKITRKISQNIPRLLLAFLIGCVSSFMLMLNAKILSQNVDSNLPGIRRASIGCVEHIVESQGTLKPASAFSSLHNLRILIVIAAYDFSQLPHLEEVLDSYQDLCVSGASKVDIVIHSTIPYPVTLIDLLNSRLVPSCQNILQMSIVLVPSSLRLHLVDCHRPFFYEKINDYDLFIYSEDDIRVSPRTVAAYLDETYRVEKKVGKSRASDFNVGIVRYEYNFPSNVVMDDKTRHATQNVTRVYWEHSMFPAIGKAVDAVNAEEFKDTHVHMKNHHQGMYLATRDLLLAWKDRNGCEFDIVKNRPGLKSRPSQPAEGTQRVWMSSQQLYGGRHCNVQQLIPIESFGVFNVLHLPNKNYRRVGHFRNRTFSNGSEKFDFGATGSLLTSMHLHLEMRLAFPAKPQHPYIGIQMIDKVTKDRTPLLERRMSEYQAYVDRGGVLSKDDMTKLLDEK